MIKTVLVSSWLAAVALGLGACGHASREAGAPAAPVPGGYEVAAPMTAADLAALDAAAGPAAQAVESQPPR